ncbi:MAG TPA: hypothetical protein VGG07_01295 [Solirubrobacteraceae bacterium]
MTDWHDHEERRAASARVSEYHEQQLRLLLDRVREGFELMDAGTIEAGRRGPTDWWAAGEPRRRR